MRLARVLLAESRAPRLALERDGCLYDVETLEERYGTRFAPERLPRSGDFHTRVVGLALAGLDELDERLARGDRPSDARLLEDEIVWLSPCDTDRVYLLEAEANGREPSYRIGNARGLVGPGVSVALPASEGGAGAELALAAILGEDMSRATHARSRGKIAGFTLVNEWRAATGARTRGASSRDSATQMGPLFVTLDEVGAPETLRGQVRVDERVVHDGPLRLTLDAIAELVAFTSHHVDLRAGDVFVLPLGFSVEVPFGTRVDVLAERLGKLSGRAIAGPAPDFRQRSTEE